MIQYPEFGYYEYDGNSYFDKFDVLDLALSKKDYNPNGRMQTLEEAIEKDHEIRQFMIEHNIECEEVYATEESIPLIVDDIKTKLKQ